MRIIVVICLSLSLLSGNALAQVFDVFPIFLKDINPGSATSNPRNFIRSGDKYFFVATCTNHPKLGDIGDEIWITDGTPEGTHLVKDIYPGAESGITTLSKLEAYRNGIAFSANDGIHGMELWFSDGTELGTTRLSDINPEVAASVTGSFSVIGDEIHFAAREDDFIFRWWVSEGTPETTRRFLDPAEIDLQGVGFFVPLPDGRLVARAFEGSVQNPELWISDGTPAGTMQIVDLEPSGGSSPLNLKAASGKVFFNADTVLYEREPYVTDGTASGTLMLADLRPPGQLGSSAYGFTEFLGETVFYASPSFSTSTLYLTDGTPEGTRDMFEDFSERPSRITGWRIIGDLIFLSASDNVTGNELWRTDGSEAGTFMIAEIGPGFIGGVSSNFITEPVDYDGKIYFTANDGVDNQVWRTTGEQGNAQKVTTHFSQLAFFPTRPEDSDAENTIKGGGPIPPIVVGVMNGQLLVVGQTEDTGMELWLLQGGNAAGHWSAFE